MCRMAILSQTLLKSEYTRSIKCTVSEWKKTPSAAGKSKNTKAKHNCLEQTEAKYTANINFALMNWIICLLAAMALALAAPTHGYRRDRDIVLIADEDVPRHGNIDNSEAAHVQYR
ncbi:hypothetical protein BJ741DRAFT_648985 [Chytriomyces cf. hyalinus JEL632]|nr:hypothetical protein BJ741DRAFT_648985 [Chytriomyces cf. hyalinus JEL632]